MFVKCPEAISKLTIVRNETYKNVQISFPIKWLGCNTKTTFKKSTKFKKIDRRFNNHNLGMICIHNYKWILITNLLLAEHAGQARKTWLDQYKIFGSPCQIIQQGEYSRIQFHLIYFDFISSVVITLKF